MTMQQTPLILSRILGRGAVLDPEVEVVTAQAGGATWPLLRPLFLRLRLWSIADKRVTIQMPARIL